MSEPLATITAVTPNMGIGPRIERYLLEQFNWSLMNKGAFKVAISDFPNAKFIIPIFGYKESWGKAQDTWDTYVSGDDDNLYYYSCGDSAVEWNGLDEPATRIPKRLRDELTAASADTGNYDRQAVARLAIRDWRIRSYARATQEEMCVKAFLPGLKTVVAHPWPVPDIPEEQWIMPDCGAWGLGLLESHQDFDIWNKVTALSEYWAYITNADFPMDKDTAAGIGARVRAVGASALLINDINLLKYIATEDFKLTKVGRALLGGMRDA